VGVEVRLWEGKERRDLNSHVPRKRKNTSPGEEGEGETGKRISVKSEPKSNPWLRMRKKESRKKKLMPRGFTNRYKGRGEA